MSFLHRYGAAPFLKPFRSILCPKMLKLSVDSYFRDTGRTERIRSSFSAGALFANKTRTVY